MMEILVEIGQLISAANNMMRAKETYESAINDVQSAANDLASKWEGEGQVAFVNDQARAYQYYTSLCQLAVEIINEVNKNAQRYRDHVQQLKSQM
jgi:WXG100 family type VII secretion target